MARCPICNNDDAKLPCIGDTTVECPRCGPFRVTRKFRIAASSAYFSPDQAANASGWVRENPDCFLREADLKWLRKLPTPSVGEKAERLLQYLAAAYPKTGAPIELHDAAGHVNPELLARAWAEDDEELIWLFRDYLASKHLVVGSRNKGLQPDAITPEGWDYLHRLRSVNPESRVGFCAMWFDADMTELHQAIANAIDKAGFEPRIMNRVEHNNRIDDEIIATIRRSRFVVADFTHGGNGVRGGVYFEAGFGLGLGLPVIHTCRHDMLDEIHFDNRQYNFVTWQANTLPDFEARLLNRITATVGIGKGNFRKGKSLDEH